MDINFILFEGFETLDVFGPVEVFGEIGDFRIHFYSQAGGSVSNRHGVTVETRPIFTINRQGVLVVPGGMGTRTLVNDRDFIEQLKVLCDDAPWCLSICTGSALLAKCGALDGKHATSNKMALPWVKSVSDHVHWVDKARWVMDGKYYTSSGVSAGTDMALGFIADRFGRETAEKAAYHIEYIWNDDPTLDEFAR